MSMRKYWRAFIFLMIIACAHKAPPLIKDRMKPKLQNITALNNRQIQFTFSEGIDTLNLKPDNFNIVSDHETLLINTLYPSLSAAEIVAITALQSDIEYLATGYAFDTAQNKGFFKEQFMGTSLPDTIAPWIVKFAEGPKQNKFYFNFSEAMDTTFFQFVTIPKKSLSSQWHNQRVCFLVPTDTTDVLAFDTTYYVYINQGCRDLSNNLFGTLITSITPDTTFKYFALKGNAMINDTLVKQGLAILKREKPLGIALIEGGDFRFKVRDSLHYTIEIFSGEYWGSALVSSVDSLNIIHLQLSEKKIDDIFN